MFAFPLGMEDVRTLASAKALTTQAPRRSFGQRWWHCIVEGFYAIPFLCTLGPATLWRTLRDVFAVVDMIRGYRSGVVRFGLLTAVKA